MAAATEANSKTLPFRVAVDNENYIRIQYGFCPQSVEESTVHRTLSSDPEDPSTGYVTHRLENGDSVRFRGNWRQKDDKTECVLLFANDEVVCVPLTGSLLNLKKDNC